MPHKCELIVSRSHDDEAYVVDVPDLPGCMAHGSTPTEAVAGAAIDLWLDAARELGRPIPDPRRRAPCQLSNSAHRVTLQASDLEYASLSPEASGEIVTYHL